MSNPHEIFTTIEDRWNWDKYIQQCDLIQLSDVDRQHAKASFAYLRLVLGEGFLRRADHERNPIFLWYFRNAAPGARLSLIRFVDALKALEGALNFGSILRDIKRRLKIEEDLKRLTEKLSIVEIAYKIFAAGFEIEFEPNVSVADHRGRVRPKIPDFRIIDRVNKQDIVVEVSRMNPSDQQRLISQTFDLVWRLLVSEGMHGDPEALKDILHPRHILPRAVIHRGIENDELQNIVRQIRALIQHVRASGEFGELVISDTIEICIASYDNHHLAREWAAKRGLREADLVTGANIVSDEIARAKVKLRNELKQVPNDKPSLIVIEAAKNLLFFVYDLRDLALVLAEELKRHPKLLWAIFYHSFVSSGDESFSVEIGPHTFTNQTMNDRSTQQALIIRNTACTNRVPLETLSKLNAAFGAN